MTVIVRPDGSRVTVQAKGSPLAGLGYQPTYGSNAFRFLGSEHSSSYARIYRTQPWVFIVVNKIARNIARIPLKAYERTDAEDGRKRIRDHELPRLLGRPTPLQGSPFRLKEAWAGSLAVFAHSLTWKYRPTPGAPPTELWPLPWDCIDPIVGTKKGDPPIIGYRYRGPLGEKTFLADDVIHMTWWGPQGAGVSPLEPLRRTLLMEDAAQRYGISSFANAARPSGVIKVAGPALSEEKKAEIRAELEGHEGPDNAFRVALLEGSMEWQPMSHTSQEAEVINHRKLNREEVAAAYDMPPPTIGILDRATFSNVSEQHRMLYQDTFGPWFTNIEETIDAELIEPERARWREVFVEFDLSGFLRGSPKERGEYQQRQFQSGQITPNQLLALENRARIENPLADCIYVPVNMVPIGPDMERVAELWAQLRGSGAPAPAGDPVATDADTDAIADAVIARLESEGRLSS